MLRSVGTLKNRVIYPKIASESGNFGLKIAAGESSVLTRKANGSQLFKVGSQVGLNDFDDFWHLLTSEFGLVEGDTVLYTLLDGNDAISSVDIDQLFASQNPGPTINLLPSIMSSAG